MRHNAEITPAQSHALAVGCSDKNSDKGCKMILNEIERAVIEKLCAGVSMPEAVDLSHPDDVSACYGYTAEQLRAYGAACRVKALEDAAWGAGITPL